MKKTLLVAAMMASFTGAAVAQNSVTLYGRLAPSVDYTSIKFNDKARTTLGIKSDTSTYNQFQTSDGYNAGGAGSNWGLKGVEDLGNGLKVSFKFEQAFTTTTGAASTSSSRVAAVTVSNAAWGSIGFGKDVGAANTIMAGTRAISGLGLANANNSLQTASQRYNNQIKYLSPTISGIRLGLSYSFEGTGVDNTSPSDFGTSNKNRVLNAGLRYANGPLVIAGLYTQINPADAAQNTTLSNYLLGATYDLKVVKLHANFGQTFDGIIGRAKLPGVVSGAFGDFNTGAILLAGAKTDQFALGLTAPVGAAGKVAFSFAQLKPKGKFGDFTQFATQTNTGISYQYNLSKRTSISGGIAYTKNLGMVDGVTTTQIGGGILHTF